MLHSYNYFLTHYIIYMKYISIGDACCVKYNIDKYRGNSETLFFDWLMTSMDSVIEILNCNDIKIY